MANPYDFTSGYLAAKELKEKRQQAEEIKAYRQEALEQQRQEASDTSKIRNRLAAIQEKDADNRGSHYNRLGLEGDARIREINARADNLIEDTALLRRFTNSTQAQKLFGAFFSSGEAIGGSQTSGNKARSLAPFSGDYSLTSPSAIKIGASYPLLESAPPLVNEDISATPQDYLGKADGTPGAVDLDRISAIQTASDQPLDSLSSDDRLEAIPVAGVQARKQRVNAPSSPANAASAPPDAQASGEQVKTPLETVAQLDPRRAASITNEVFGASKKEFNQMLGAFGVLNVVRGKSTPQSLLEMTAAMDTLRKEGVEKGVLRALNGDSAGALKAFDESGEFDAKDIKKIGTFKITNPVQGAGKLTDTYDGVLVQFNNGPDLKIDPRKLAAERKGLEWLLTFNENKEKAMRDDNRMTQANANSAEFNKLRNEELKLQREREADEKARLRVDNDLKALQTNLFNAFVGSKGGIEQAINPEEKQREVDKIVGTTNVVKSIANLNINNGNRGVDTGTIAQYMPYLGQIRGDDDPALQFWNNPDNFARGPNGKPLAKIVNGRVLMQTTDGVILPRPIMPRKGAVPPRPGVVDPRLDPGN